MSDNNPTEPNSSYDSAADEHYAPQQPASSAQLEDGEQSFGAPSDDRKDNKNDSAEGVKAAEEKPEESEESHRARTSARGQVNEKLNKGYTGGEKTGKTSRQSRLYNSKSGLKKRVAIAGALAGGSIIGGVLVFLALLPLKIESIVTDLEGKFASASTQAMESEGDNIFNSFMTKQVLPNLNKGTCHSTIDAGCVTASDSNSPLGHLYNAWKDSRMEQTLASRYGLVFTKQGSKYYMNVDGKDYQIHSAENIFDLEGTNEVTRTDIRRAVRAKIKEGTLWDKVYLRFKVNSFVRKKYGVKQCFPDRACAKVEKITDAVKDRKLSAEAFVIRNVMPQKYGIILQCIMSGSCDTKLDPANPGDTEKLSSFDKKLQEQMAAYVAQFGSEKLGDLVKKASAISKDGITKTVAREAIKSIVTQLGGDGAGAAAGDAAEKAVPVVGWVFFGATVVAGAATIGPLLQHADYMLNSASAVQVAQTYSTVVSEAHDGKYIDADTFGSFASSLGSNLDNSSSDRSDVTQTPLYNSYFNGPDAGVNTASIFSSLFPIGSADAPSSFSSKYTCDNGKPVPAGQRVCSEEVLNKGNNVANAISDFTNAVPGLVPIAKPVSALGSVFTDTIGSLMEKIPGVSQVIDFVGQLPGLLLNPIMKALISIPFSEHQSGGRTGDMIAAGMDVSSNESCQTLLGCKMGSSAEVAQVQQQQLAEDQANFQDQSFFARVFDSTSPFSLTSRLAVSMPTNLTAAANSGLGSLLAAPFSTFTNLFGNLFSSARPVSAATPQKDAFGVPQSYYPSSDIPSNPDAYWAANCVNGPKAKYNSATQQLDVSDWLNSQVEDPGGAGTAVATTTNPCLLIQSAVQSMGGSSDASLLPKDSTTTSAPATGSVGGTLPTGTTQQLAQQIKNNPNISFQTPQEAAWFDQIVATGHATDCGKPTISPKLLGVILVLAQKYKIVLGVLDDGHGCDSGFHPKGMAVDINGVNPLSGSGGTGSKIDYSAGQLPILRNFYQDAGTVLAANGGGGLGQQQCFGSPPPKVNGVVYFDDTCNHLHMDVGNR